ncbi:MAG: GntR family transcriptional regulator, transcriptional repressor for pyruvate dehydrogenase complex [Solirubrobacteraceae bacterium]|nr:GntR family transcriptional regulator, transcriptional repressor for pyruvate dehydrogenase complex [Solirubrobacteraceae bacterium]
MVPAPRTPLSESIFVRLRDGILGGRPAPGEPLPSERVFADELGCNRHAVREAVKRLQQAGLVEVSHGGATRVLDWRATGGLDLLAQLPLARATTAEHLRSVLELRLCVGVDAARRCAQRAPAPTVAALRATLDVDDPDDPSLHYALLWDRIIDGADNLAYRLAYNRLLAGLAPGEEPSRTLFAAETMDTRAQAALVDAIADADAARAATDLLARALNGVDPVATADRTATAPLASHRLTPARAHRPARG